MYLGDADGFSIMYYSDVDSIVYWANEAVYTYGVSGIAIWSLGQEDMRLWDSTFVGCFFHTKKQRKAGNSYETGSNNSAVCICRSRRLYGSVLKASAKRWQSSVW